MQQKYFQSSEIHFNIPTHTYLDLPESNLMRSDVLRCIVVVDFSFLIVILLWNKSEYDPHNEFQRLKVFWNNILVRGDQMNVWFNSLKALAALNQVYQIIMF